MFISKTRNSKLLQAFAVGCWCSKGTATKSAGVHSASHVIKHVASKSRQYRLPLCIYFKFISTCIMLLLLKKYINDIVITCGVLVLWNHSRYICNFFRIGLTTSVRCLPNGSHRTSAANRHR